MGKTLPVIRCSGLDRLLRCPGSRVLAPLVRRRGDESAAWEGTLLHWRIADGAIASLGAFGPEGGLPPPRVPENYTLPAGVGWVREYCLAQLGIVPADSSLEVESGFAYEFDGFILSGHIDAFAITADGEAAWGFDWKTGRNPVDPADQNWQVLGYIALLKRAFPALQEVTFRIVQPWNSEKEGNPRISETTLDGTGLDGAARVLGDRVRDALAREDELDSGLAQCRWCPAGIQCPAIQKEIIYMKANLTPELLAKIKAEADDALLGDMVVAARTVKPAVEQAEALLNARLEKTEAVQAGCGICITRRLGRGKYTALHPDAIYNELAAMLPPDRLAPALDYPVTRIKDAIADSLGVPKKGKAPITADSIFNAKLAPHFEQGVRVELIFS
ncbi:MAG: PD-(D/E)XK nuclease family protein [Opitutaceae bacterium]|jgi:hypothetical protein|nr:PD-(D/E)XK nuclease family protein [Opitutaceae bacterium]